MFSFNSIWEMNSKRECFIYFIAVGLWLVFIFQGCKIVLGMGCVPIPVLFYYFRYHGIEVQNISHTAGNKKKNHATEQ